MSKAVAIVLAVAIIIISVLVNKCHGCWGEEKAALLRLKASMNYPNDSSYLLQTWVDNEEHNADCCMWTGVECNTTTNRVIKLHLSRARYWASSYWYFNASLFLPFQELKSLDLSFNYLAGCIENEGYEVLSKLRSLEDLDLSDNIFDDDSNTLFNLSGITSLKSLYLSENNLTGFDFINDLSRLRNLEVLDLSYNLFNDSILSLLNQFSYLKSLDLSYNRLTGSYPINELQDLANLEALFLDGTSLPVHFLRNIGALSTLQILSLNECHLNGTLPNKGLCEMKNLKELYLKTNKLEGLLPACLGNLSTLRVLDIAENKFAGSIALSPLTNLTLLEVLSISSNFFQVPVSFNSFMNHSSLKFISCGNTELIEDPAFQTRVPKFQLLYLSFLYCRSKAPNLQLPNFLHSQFELIFLDLSYNKFTGTLPSWLLDNNPRLEALYLDNNLFTGLLKLPYHANLSTLDISNNNIYGQFPKHMCLLFPHLSRLWIANNGLIGSIPPSWGNMSSLLCLDLSGNQLSGGIPDQLAALQFLKLSNNNLDGQISPSVCNSSSIGNLYLNGNNFSGQIMDICGSNSPNFNTLDISNNFLSGMLPRGIGNVSAMAIDASRNHFEGPIPAEICKNRHLRFLDLSVNFLFGSIPLCFNQTRIFYLHLYKNQLSGSFPYAFYNSSYLVTLDLRENNFAGSIPNWIGTLSRLSYLLLKYNHFDGHLPTQICLLKQLSILDLSHNKFSGSLPPCLSILSFNASSMQPFVFFNYFLQPAVMEVYAKSIGRAKLPRSRYPIHENAAVKEAVEFTTKGNSYAYQGDILRFMTGIDFSCNSFTGEIPSQLGNLREIHALNLSHNNLTRSIPTTFSNLKQIESLDLSHNNLNGTIPPELVELTTLSVFSVAYNDLSGKTPERKAQFGTFDKSSYEENPLLCGPPLDNNCKEVDSSAPVPNGSSGNKDDVGFMDMDVFYASFGLSYVIVLLGIAAVLFINPYWRRAWFYMVEEWLNTCYYFILDHFHKPCRFK